MPREEGIGEPPPRFEPLGRTRGGLRFRPPTAALVWAALAIVAANLTIVALRSDLTRVRYDLSQASAELRQLDEEGRVLTLEFRKLQDPRRLSEIAKSRGFGPPERIVDLP
jgi:cell division protein FtsL